MTYEEWMEKFKPELDKHGDPVVYNHIRDIKQDHLGGRVWSWQYDSEDSNHDQIVAGGWATNNLGYYICEIPYTEEESGIVIDIWDDWVDPDEEE